jgi:hypothetical protein
MSPSIPELLINKLGLPYPSVPSPNPATRKTTSVSANRALKVCCEKLQPRITVCSLAVRKLSIQDYDRKARVLKVQSETFRGESPARFTSVG